MSHTRIDLEAILHPYAHRLPVGRIVLAPAALAEAGAVFRGVLPDGLWLLVADGVTDGVAGARLERRLTADGLRVARLTLAPQQPESPLVADERKVAELADRIRAWPGPVVAAIAVGAGTINDLVKMATFRCGLPYAVVPTAPSMNGYTSPIAAILSDGVKTVQDAQLPRAVLADLDIIARAPARMIAAGFSDLLSKPVANADWLLSHELTGSAYSPDVIRLVEEGNRLLAGLAGRLPARDPEAVAALTAALVLSGYAMGLAGTSAPASGGEHLISHYLDMTHYAFGEPNDLHGCQVGVGTRVSAALYERLMALDREAVDVDERVGRLAPWAQYEQGIRTRFGALAEAVVPHAREAYPTPERLRRRLTDFKIRWPEIGARLRPTLRTSAAVLADLQAARCPTTFTEIGAAPDRARRAVVDGKDIRARYTILHFCWELGVLDAWADEILPQVY
jgi:glycerol-1-phosphate dehydrogenase [NAD(P)+]